MPTVGGRSICCAKAGAGCAFRHFPLLSGVTGEVREGVVQAMCYRANGLSRHHPMNGLDSQARTALTAVAALKRIRTRALPRHDRLEVQVFEAQELSPAGGRVLPQFGAAWILE